MLKAVIFDMDGVLIDSEPLHAKAAVMALARFQISISMEYCYRFIGTTTRHMYETTIEDYHLQASLEDLLAADKECKDYLIRTEGYPAIPHVCRLVREIHDTGLLTAVASSSTMEEIRTNTAAIGISDCFDLFVSGTQVPNPKPAPDIFLKAAADLGVLPEETVIIEDSSFGIRAGKTAGAACVGFANPNSGRQDLSMADLVVEGFEEVDVTLLTQVWERFRDLPLTVAVTPRIILRELCAEDAPDLFRLNSDPSIRAALTNPASSLSEERDILEAYIRNIYRFYGYGLWGVFRKEDAALIGRCGLSPFRLNDSAAVELGYYISPQYRRQGFGYEAASRTLNLAKEQFGLRNVYARTSEDNTASLHLLHRLGMHPAGQDGSLLLFQIEF